MECPHRRVAENYSDRCCAGGCAAQRRLFKLVEDPSPLVWSPKPQGRTLWTSHYAPRGLNSIGVWITAKRYSVQADEKLMSGRDNLHSGDDTISDTRGYSAKFADSKPLPGGLKNANVDTLLIKYEMLTNWLQCSESGTHSSASLPAAISPLLPIPPVPVTSLLSR
jgi:hypothetical protein